MNRLTREWVEKAESDALVAESLDQLGDRTYGAICFHCQQSAEKYLKALLQEAGQPVPRTHNLLALENLLRPIHPTVHSLRRGLDFLNRFAVDIRYPGFRAQKRQAKSSLRWSERVRLLCRQLLGLRPNPPGRRVP
jgi:HEPN domain-containing protein